MLSGAKDQGSLVLVSVIFDLVAQYPAGEFDPNVAFCIGADGGECDITDSGAAATFCDGDSTNPGASCAANGDCTGGDCRGVACLTDADCSGGTCVGAGGACVGGDNADDPCVAGVDCESGICDITVTEDNDIIVPTPDRALISCPINP